MKTTSVLDERYGGLRDTLEDLYQVGVISIEELNCVILDLLLCELEDVWNNC